MILSHRFTEALIYATELHATQIGKLTEHPTLRWVFQYLQGIHLFTINGRKQVINLTSERSFI
ncbi:MULTISPECIES: hypothetical protein [Okeania]|uniref:hypothetical protein n=1 Tax=Okeania TaxID=1458928 RepID=UPI000F536C0C|nr:MULTISPECIES: hypothetical protein [Okeania]NEP06102.1 hypothetical protein [Okeania sp. SIO4D6]NEP39165.1 hypothetical protein [Okeania sp. SIO2H7]NEP75038.1 hypothetical protein [Okeania sp. SIO2G5]NEP96122.1 hypothetical protein [Okeania sp. SIO2F5]NEQ93888.1 hypothetical protein [Okeania sp. SIO2G4]